MSTAERYDEQARAKGRELAKRIADDPDFRRQVEQDPAGALTGAGLPANAVVDFVNEVGITTEVEGYRMCDHTCDWSCFITGPRP
jgi:hypothetical protein